MITRLKTPALLILLTILSLANSAVAVEGSKIDPAYEPFTTEDPDIPRDELALLVKPLTAEELQAEADAWLGLLQQKTRETSQAELAIRRKNKAIEQAEEVQESLEETKAVLDEVKDVSEGGGSAEAAEEASKLAEKANKTASESVDMIEEVVTSTQEVARDDVVQDALATSEQVQSEVLSEKAEKAREATEQVSRKADETAAAADSGMEQEAEALAEETVVAVSDAKSALVETSAAVSTAVEQQQNIAVVADGSQLEETADIVADIAESQMEDKKDILVSMNELKAQRTRLADRLNVVLDELSTKLVSNADDGENEIVAPYRLYALAVSDIAVDVSDTQALWSNIVGWMTSEVGGIRLAQRVGKFLLTLVAFWILGIAVGKILDKTLAMTRITVELMRSVIVRSVRRGIFLVGIIVGLSVIEINVGPILAVVGAAGFVVAFALQNTLSNFASGIMIMFYRPYDVGDIIKVGGVVGRARSMNLVNTTIATFDNQLLIVPNNNIWGDIITNITGSDTRRVDLLFRITYEDDIDTALRVLHEVVEEHPLVLQEPAAVIEVQELGEYTVNIICWSWAKTVDYWQVYRDITRSAKEGFEAAGMQTPYPKQNIRSLDWSGER